MTATAWLTTHPGALDQTNMDLTVLDATSRELFHAITEVDAFGGEAEEGIDAARELLDDAGWRVTGEWQDFPLGVVATVERAQAPALVTVNIVILHNPTVVRGMEWGLAIGEAPALAADDIYLWLAEVDHTSGAYPVAVLEQDWDSAELAAHPYYTVRIPATQAGALDAVIAAQG